MIATPISFRTLKSELDSSINYVANTLDGGKLECRFVQRDDSYFIIYVSSHSGCRQACRMCHLTQTGQTMMTDTGMFEYAAQISQVLGELPFEEMRKPERVHVNFMARGEPLLNKHLTGCSRGVPLSGLTRYTRNRLPRDWSDVPIHMNLSTIMPVEIAGEDLVNVVGPAVPGVNLYYSLYSTEPDFRRRWLPRAMDWELALDKLAVYQASSANPGLTYLHWAFIDGQNDADADVERIIEAVNARGLKVRFNAVRYNPFDGKSKEAPEETVRRLTEKLAVGLNAPESRVVTRVGFDVAASCGMFVNE